MAAAPGRRAQQSTNSAAKGTAKPPDDGFFIGGKRQVGCVARLGRCLPAGQRVTGSFRLSCPLMPPQAGISRQVHEIPAFAGVTVTCAMLLIG